MQALACEPPSTLGLPLSRFSRSELRRQVLAAGIVADISGATIWRWLHADALRPRTRRSWIFQRDPEFGPKAGRVLDLYHRQWGGRRICGDEFVISADEKTQIPIRTRRHPITPPGPGRAPCGSSTSAAAMASAPTSRAWDIHRVRLFGVVVAKISIVAFDDLVAQVMAREPYRSAKRVFRIVDGGTIHCGQRAVDRLQGRFDNLTLVHLPTHASWINQIEIHFSILQRKAPAPAHFSSQDEVAERILGFQRHYQQIASPFELRFTRSDLGRLLARPLAPAHSQLPEAA